MKGFKMNEKIKYDRFVILIITIVFSLSGCNFNNLPGETTTPSVSSETPFDTVTQTDTQNKNCKAVGFEYDLNEIEYKLVWSDEFDYEGLPDESKWSYDFGGGGWGNNELQFYTRGENAYVSNGNLTITARKEPYHGRNYTSTRLVSKGKGDWLYGRIEVRAKLPSGTGTWPAIWMLPTDSVYGGWPRSGEIDIMEHVGYQMGVVHGTIHTEAYNHMKGTQIGKQIIRNDAAEKFYTYAIEWLPDKISWYVDDVLYFVFKPGNMLDCPGIEHWPFDQKFHLLLNIAIGGNWGGAAGIDDDIFPQEMVIEYVRVYQADVINNLIKEMEN